MEGSQRGAHGSIGSWSQQQRSLGALEVRGRVHVSQRPLDGQRHANFHAIFERPQLLELLDLLQARAGRLASLRSANTR